jgi:EmrB/QacA subfamily drug resistance transporter
VTTHAPPARSAHPGLILALTCAAQFMVVLDIAIVNVALPSIQTDLHLEQSALQWIVIAYGLMLGGFLLLGGRLGDHLGRRRVLLAGLVLFAAASLLAGLAESGTVLIGARALQGFGAALIPPSTLAIIATTFAEGPERNRALGLYGAVAGVSASIGVLASGLLTDHADWRWIFFINVPIGVVLLAAAAAILRDDRPAGPREPFDVAGAVTVTGGLISLLYAVSRGADKGWDSATTLAWLAVSAVLLGAFAWVESRSHSPLVPRSVLRNRPLLAANLAAFTTFGGFFAFIFVGSLLMQQSQGYSATETGLAWLTTSVSSFFAAGLAGAKLVQLLGSRTLLTAGLVGLAVAAGMLARVPADASYVTHLMPPLLLAGITVGAAAPAIQIAALTGTAHDQTGLASGLIETLRELGGAVVLAGASTAMVTVLTSDDVARGTAGPLDAFHAASWVIAGVAAVGAAVTLAAFPRTGAPMQQQTPEPSTVPVD